MLKLSSSQIKKLQKQGRIKSEPKKVSGRMDSFDANPYIFICNINTEPQSKQRARTFADKNILAGIFNQSKGNLKKFMALLSSNSFMKTLTPENTKHFEKHVAMACQQIMLRDNQKPFAVPVEMCVRIRIKGTNEQYPVAQADGDLDNHEKAIKDAMNGIVYIDDRLVVRKYGIKICADIPGIDIMVKQITKDDLEYFSDNYSSAPMPPVP